MDSKANALQTTYRDLFQADIALSTDAMLTKQRVVRPRPFASIDKIMKDIEKTDRSNVHAF